MAYPASDFFDQAISELQNNARLTVEHGENQDRPHLPQVHALNCLKDIFTNTFLGPSSERHLEQALGLSVDCLSHEMWVNFQLSET